MTVIVLTIYDECILLSNSQMTYLNKYDLKVHAKPQLLSPIRFTITNIHSECVITSHSISNQTLSWGNEKPRQYQNSVLILF